MNKIVTVALIAGGLLLLDAPEAAAHKEVRTAYQSPHYHRFETQRVRKMPFWLKQNRSFRKWYRHSGLRHNRYLGWRQIFRIYRWERAYMMQHRRSHWYFQNDEFHGHRDRVKKRDKRRRRS